jgi:hypothetical protein
VSKQNTPLRGVFCFSFSELSGAESHDTNVEA